MKLPEGLSLKASVHTLEDAIITLSGPALAISGIIAGVDLLTGGNMLKQMWWLSLAWAITLLLTLDFQVLSLGARAHQMYISEDEKKSAKRKFFEIALAVIIAAAISYVSIQMQSIIARSNSAGLDINTATVQLGINPIWLIWERSALVLVLIFLSGWFRQEQAKQSVSTTVPSGTPAETLPSISDETVQLILSKLAKLDQLEQAIAEQKVTVIQEPVPPLALPVPKPVSLETLALNRPQVKIRPGFSILNQIEAMTEAENEDMPVAKTSEVVAQSDEASLEAQIKALLVEKPDLSSRKVAELLERPHSTVYRLMKQLEQK